MTRPAAGHVDAVGAVGVVDGLFLAFRLVASHGQAHPLAQQAVKNLTAIVEAATPPFSLQFIRQAVFRDKVLVPFDLAGFEKSQVLAQAMGALGVQELFFEGQPQEASMLSLAGVLAHPVVNDEGYQGEIAFPGVLLREIPGANLAQSAEAVDPEVFLAGQLALAVADAEELVEHVGKPWPWFLGLSCARRVERCLGVGAVPLLRALEIAPGEWSVARRAVAAAVNTGVALAAVGVGVRLRKVGIHAALALAVHGLDLREGKDLRGAAEATLPALLPPKGGRPLEPHKSKVCALVHRLAGTAARAGKPGLGQLLWLTYRMEVARLPVGLDFALTLADLVAQIHAEGLDGDARWLEAIIHASGAIPPGARVRLPDGRVGLVLGPGDLADARCPKVWVGGTVVQPRAAVELLGPREARGAEHGA